MRNSIEILLACQAVRKLALFFVLVVVCAGILFSCVKTSPETVEKETISLKVPKTDVIRNKDSQFITITASGDWTLSLNYGGQAGGWASLRDTTGTGSGNTILYWEANDTGKSRIVTVVLSCGEGEEQSASVNLTQSATNSVIPVIPTELNPDPVPEWLELPATEDRNRYFFTHDMTFPSTQKKVRNYSLYLDASAKIAFWVAYPLNKTYLSGSIGRTDAWALDPKIPEAYQPVLNSSFPGSYDRGHQIPSADRPFSGANEQTFYGSNMTPQLDVLNQQSWASLEGVVRVWSNKFDTLYVVTGADLSGRLEYTTDNKGKSIAVPNGYFKALLGYKSKNASSIEGQVDGYIGIGFYYEHRKYSTATMLQSMSIDELERMVECDFFVNLGRKIGTAKAEQVESTVSPWWSNNK